MYTKLTAMFALIASAPALTACGGGGGSSDQTSTSAATPFLTPVPASDASPAPTLAPVPPSAAAATVSPLPLTFPITTFGVASAPLAAVITNSGRSTFTVKSVRNDVQFQVVGGTCLTLSTFLAGSSCSLDVVFTPSVHGNTSGSLAITTDVLQPITVAVAGTSPATTTLILGGKTFVLPYPTTISALPDTDPSTLPTDVTASLWSLVAAVPAFGDGPGSPATLNSEQLLSSVQWPIHFGYWRLQSSAMASGTGCKVDLVGSSLVLTANGVATAVPLDGTLPVLNTRGQPYLPGDVLRYWAGERTVGVVSVDRAVQIDAFDGSLQGNYNALTLYAGYDSHGSGAYGTAMVSRGTPNALQQHVCSDTP